MTDALLADLKALAQQWRAESGSWEPGIGSGISMCADELTALLTRAATPAKEPDALVARCTGWLMNGGFFNPAEMAGANPDGTRELIIDLRDALRGSAGGTREDATPQSSQGTGPTASLPGPSEGRESVLLCSSCKAVVREPVGDDPRLWCGVCGDRWEPSERESLRWVRLAATGAAPSTVQGPSEGLRAPSDEELQLFRDLFAELATYGKILRQLNRPKRAATIADVSSRLSMWCKRVRLAAKGAAAETPALPPSLQASVELFRANPAEWHAEWSRMHQFKVGLLEQVQSLKAELTALQGASSAPSAAKWQQDLARWAIYAFNHYGHDAYFYNGLADLAGPEAMRNPSSPRSEREDEKLPGEGS